MKILIQTGENKADSVLQVSDYESPEVIDYFRSLIQTKGKLFNRVYVPIYFNLSWLDNRNSVEHDCYLYNLIGVKSNVFKSKPDILLTNPFTKSVLAYLRSLPNNVWVWIPDLSPECCTNKVWEIKGTTYTARLQAFILNSNQANEPQP